MDKVICFECGSVDEYELRDSVRRYEGDGYSFTLPVKVPFCKRCGAPMTIETIEETIDRQANERIRECRGIIKKEEILEILSNYHVSQKLLSRLLGWGEITLTRYISGGYTPSISNSNKLKALKDPYVVQQLIHQRLEEGEIEVKNENLLKKLQKSIDKNIEDLENSKGKIYEIVNWFLSQATDEEPLTHLALQKLLYFAQNWNRIWNGQWLFDNDCEAWIHGAVFRNVYDDFKKFKYHPLPKVYTHVELSEDELAVLAFVKKYYFDVYSARTLEWICHLEEPYQLARKGLRNDENGKQVIEKENMFAYYSKIADKYHISRENTDSVKNYFNDLLC